MTRIIGLKPLFLASMCMMGLASDARADLSVTAWDLRTQVFDSPEVVQDVDGTNIVQNPFQGQFGSSMPPSTAGATYQISWNANSLFLNLESALHAESLEGNVASFGFMNVTPEVDSILSFDSAFQYSLSTQTPQTIRADLSFKILTTNPTQVVYNNSQYRLNFFGPPSGTMIANDDIFLPAGQLRRVQWSFNIDHFGDATPGATSNGSGHLAFEIHPVPEPVMLFPLAFTALLIRRRRGLIESESPQ